MNTWDWGGELTTLHRENTLLRNADDLDKCSAKFSSIATVTIQKHVHYRYYNTQQIHVRVLQYKTCKPTAITIQNLYTCTTTIKKHVHYRYY